MKRNWQIFLGIPLSIFLLYLVFGRLDYRELMETLKRANYLLLLFSLSLLLFHMVIRALRWEILLRPVKRMRFSSLLGTLFIGFMANNFLPARMGDVARGYLLGKLESFPKASSFATLIAEKFLDGFTILSTFAILSLALRNLNTSQGFYRTLAFGGYFSLGLFTITLVVFLLIRYSPDTFMRIFKPSGWSNEAKGHLYSFREGLGWFDRWDCLLPSVGLSYLIWITYALGIHITSMAFSLKVPFIASFLAMVAVCIVTTLPFTPGYIGTYHAALSYSLILYGVPMEKAAAVALVFHALFFLPTTLLGILFLWHYHLSLSSLRQEVKGN